MDLVFDVETTDFAYCDIIQLSYILFDHSGIAEIGDNYYRTEKSITPGAASVHGLTQRRLQGLSSVRFVDDVANTVRTFRRANRVICHNVAFDTRTIESYGIDILTDAVPSRRVCTMSDYLQFNFKRVCDKGSLRYEFCTLEESIVNMVNRGLLNPLELESEYLSLTGKQPKLHDSMYDTFLTYKLFLCLDGLKIALGGGN